MFFKSVANKLNRRKQRITAFEVVEIKDKNGAPSGIGVVKNISEYGARITIFEAEQLPAKFELWLPGARLGAHARIRWRLGNDIGVHFRKPIYLDLLPGSQAPAENSSRLPNRTSPASKRP